MSAAVRYRFGEFELDAGTGELRRKGVRVRLHVQPMQVLVLLVERPGDLLTREEICRALWPEGTFVDFEHGVNSCVNRLREALGDKAGNPRFVETLARRGYRFVAPVERVDAEGVGDSREKQVLSLRQAQDDELSKEDLSEEQKQIPLGNGKQENWLATEADLPRTAPVSPVVLFVLLQVMYLGFYAGALANLGEIGELLAPLAHAEAWFNVVLMSAAVLIPLRVFLGCAAMFGAPRLRQQFLRLWPLVLAADLLWALSPFLLLHHMNAGAALACMAPLVYAPFAQRALVLMMGSGAKAERDVRGV